MPEPTTDIALYLLLLPFLGFIAISTLDRFLPKKGGVVATAVMGVCLALSAWLFTGAWGNEEAMVGKLTWLNISDSVWHFSWTIDNYSAVMLLVVSLVTFLVMLFSMSYMKGEKHYNRYFAYLCLFAGAMLGLVLMQNIVLVYAFWELVGLASYLLIGFWQEKRSAARASQKAFLVNRIGDAGFLIGIIALYQAFGTLDIAEMLTAINKGVLSVEENPWMLVAALGICAGALGKSAQLPFSVWLPDAMEGPTPVSALLHAATMVAAGVYLLARMSFALPVEAHWLLLVIGSLTAFFGAFSAISQFDIKKVLAYSTISQLGYMFMAIGAGFPALAMFHLLTHAFFKACLFLGAGAIIHSVHHAADAYGAKVDAQDIRIMGGLRKRMPIIFYTFIIAAFSLAGMPIFSGFLSKDAILVGLMEQAQTEKLVYIPLLLGLLVAGMTSFYVGRLLMRVFWGEPRNEALAGPYVHDADKIMRWPLFVLSGLSLWIWFAWSPLDASKAWFLKGTAAEMAHGTGAYIIMALSAILALGGLELARRIYMPDKNIGWAESLISEESKWHKVSFNAFYIDKVYRLMVKVLVEGLASLMAWIDKEVINRIVDYIGIAGVIFSHIVSWTDRHVLDGLVRFSAYFTGGIGRVSISLLQQGKVQGYVAWVLIALLGLVMFAFL